MSYGPQRPRKHINKEMIVEFLSTRKPMAISNIALLMGVSSHLIKKLLDQMMNEPEWRIHTSRKERYESPDIIYYTVRKGEANETRQRSGPRIGYKTANAMPQADKEGTDSDY